MRARDGAWVRLKASDGAWVRWRARDEALVRLRARLHHQSWRILGQWWNPRVLSQWRTLVEQDTERPAQEQDREPA